MKPEYVNMLATAKQSADIVVQAMQLSATADKTSDYRELADIAAVMHKAADALNEVKKVLNKYSDAIALKAAQLAMTSGDYGPIKTPMVTATIKPKSWYHLPSSRKADPTRFDAIMKANGIPEEVYTNELVRFHAPALADYAGANGKPPLGTELSDLSTTVLTLSFRWKE